MYKLESDDEQKVLRNMYGLLGEQPATKESAYVIVD